MVGVRCVTFDTAYSRLFSGSALSARLVTGNSFRGSHVTSGKNGCPTVITDQNNVQNTVIMKDIIKTAIRSVADVSCGCEQAKENNNH